MYKAIPTDGWYTPNKGDIVWRKHAFALVPALIIPLLFGLSCVVLCVGSYLSGAIRKEPWLILLQCLMTITVILIGFHIEDWKDEMYIVTKEAIVYQWRHPFSYESGKRMPKDRIGFTVAELGLKRAGERVWSLAGFFRWLVGCGTVSVYGPSARIALEMHDVFLPAQKKQIIDKWLGAKK